MFRLSFFAFSKTHRKRAVTTAADSPPSSPSPPQSYHMDSKQLNELGLVWHYKGPVMEEDLLTNTTLEPFMDWFSFQDDEEGLLIGEEDVKSEAVGPATTVTTRNWIYSQERDKLFDELSNDPKLLKRSRNSHIAQYINGCKEFIRRENGKRDSATHLDRFEIRVGMYVVQVHPPMFEGMKVTEVRCFRRNLAKCSYQLMDASSLVRKSNVSYHRGSLHMKNVWDIVDLVVGLYEITCPEGQK